MTAITSLTNPKVKLSVKLRQHNKRRDTRLFLIEGYRELLRAIDAGHPVQTLFYCPELFLGENERELIERTDAEILSCSPDVFRKISYRDRPDGLLAIAPQ
ncbi:MAG: RNA methyltransferase, partial [Chlamydiia bacterium]|nr:RNA methyltransferase [Chlamydiia bacterium]